MADFASSQELIHALCKPGLYPHAAKSVDVVETHISWVLLAGRYAYKIKKPVSLGFLNFTRLSARRMYCEEEVRLNRRLAPSLYLEVVPIGGTPEHPELGAMPAIEYAVKMRRFAAGRLLDQLLTRGQLTSRHIDLLATQVAKFHAGLPSAAPDSGYGTPQTIAKPMRQNFQGLTALLNGADADLISELQSRSEREYAANLELFELRRRGGLIRECHGDLHLGNIVLLHGVPVPFDGIEFDPRLRWIDVMSEVAFVVMDLMHRDRHDLAFRFLNAYLEVSGDYRGLGVLRFYLGYRAMVRAKISAIRAKQGAATGIAECHRYLALSNESLGLYRPALILTHGLPGSGKSAVSQVAVERLHAVRIRSDVERKRLFGLAAQENSHERIAGGIYGRDATRRTYAKLRQLAAQLLNVGFTVIIDAAFLKRCQRRDFQTLAAELAAPFVIVDVRADTSKLRQRVGRRSEVESDASEADLDVLELLAAGNEPFQADEHTHVIEFDNSGSVNEISSQMTFWSRLDDLVSSGARRRSDEDNVAGCSRKPAETG